MAKKPNIRFKGFTKEWEEKPFSETYITASEGGTPTTGVKEFYEGGDIPFVKIEDTENKYIFKTNAHITTEGVNRSSAWLIPEDNIIFTNGATVGNVAINKIPVTTKQGILGVVTDKDKFDLEYLYYVLSADNFQSEVERRQSKGTFATIILSHLNKIDFAVTSIEEQQKIGDFFKTLDELIGAKEEELEKLRQLKQALLQQMFPAKDEEEFVGGGISQIINSLDGNTFTISAAPNTPRIRFKGFTEPWELCNISSKAKFSKGKGYSKSDLTESGNLIILYGMLYTNYNTFIYDSKQHASMKNGSVVSEGCEVVIPASGETAEYIARASAILKSGIIIGGDLNIIRPNDTIEPGFLALELTYGKSHKELVKKAQGISVVHLHNSDIEELDIMLPSIEEQQKISAFFHSQDTQINAAQEQITKLRTIKQALLQKMFA